MMGGFFVLTTHVYEEKLPFDIKECELHTLIHTFALSDLPPHVVEYFPEEKCELRDVI
jgi:hypothetical protein